MFSIFSLCGISVWIWITSSSGLVRIGSYRSPVSSGIFFVIIIFSLPFRMSRSISSHQPYFLPSPLGHSRCFGVISPLVYAVSFRLLFSVRNSGREINFRCNIFLVSILTVFWVKSIAVCISFGTFLPVLFCCYFFLQI